jgi:hypothetical protein
MMNGKAMHVSTIARPDKTNPYFMVYANMSSINSRDLGKLVETGHRLIISRLAAIRSARNFTDVSDVIRKIAAECSCIRRSFSENVPIEQIKQRMTDTSTMFSLLEKLCVGDPNNRLRMVEKHKTEFDNNCRELQIASIGTYKQFDKYTAGVLLLKVRWAHKLLHKYNKCSEQYVELQSMVADVVTSVNAEVTAKKYSNRIVARDGRISLISFVSAVLFWKGDIGDDGGGIRVF